MLNPFMSLKLGVDSCGGGSYNKWSAIIGQGFTVGHEAMISWREEGHTSSSRGVDRGLRIWGCTIAVLGDRASLAARVELPRGRRTGSAVETRGTTWFWFCLVEARSFCTTALGVVHLGP